MPELPPIVYDHIKVDRILDLLADGQSLREICRSEGMPPASTFLGWVLRSPALAELYTRARSMGLQMRGDEITDIADNATNDYMDRKSETGTQRCLDAENVNRSRLRIETRKWELAKLMPRVYGDFERIELTGKDGGPVEMSVAETLRQKRAERLRAKSE